MSALRVGIAVAAAGTGGCLHERHEPSPIRRRHPAHGDGIRQPSTPTPTPQPDVRGGTRARRHPVPGARDRPTAWNLRRLPRGGRLGGASGSPSSATPSRGSRSTCRPGRAGASAVPAGRTPNVIASPPGFDDEAPHRIVGAHLDTVPQAPGAEDNASGVAVMLELARVHADSERSGAIHRLHVRGATRPGRQPAPLRLPRVRQAARRTANATPCARWCRSIASVSAARPSRCAPAASARWRFVGSSAPPGGTRTSRPVAAPTTAPATTGRSSGTTCRRRGSAASRTPRTTRPATSRGSSTTVSSSASARS